MSFTFDEGAWTQIVGDVADEVEKAAIRVENAAKRMAPVDTGRLRSSITHTEPVVSGDTVTCQVGSDVEYAAYVELGTSKMSAQPYLRPALKAAGS